jgi:Tol biopolymer transport system component
MSALVFGPSARRRWRIGAGVFVLALALGGLATSASAAQHPARATAQVVAPDTGRLTFVRSNQIYTSKPDGTSVTELTSVGKNYRPKWSPSGSRIAYVHETASGLRDIWVMSKTGSAKQQVTHLGDTTEPTWSPRGRWLAFGAAGTPPYSTFLSTPLQKIRSTAPFGSPITFPSSPDFDLRVVGTLDWSPGGKQIAYYSDTYPDSPDHYLLSYHTDTLAVDELSSVGGSCCGEGYFGGPAWSPDARSLAYTELAFDLGQPAPAGPHIAMLGMRTTASPRFPHVVGDSQPAFSPSGRRLVFVHKATIDVANVDGSGRHVVTTGSQPDWQPVS